MGSKHILILLLIIFEKAINKVTKDKDSLYIAVDFGSYKTFYAYNFGNDINNIIYGRALYIPSETILYRNLNIKNYGATSFSSFINYNKEEKNEVVYIRNLKNNLFDFENSNQLIKDNIYPINYEVPLETAIVEYLKRLTNDIIKEIKNLPKYKNLIISKKDSQWIFTIPKIWSIEAIIFFKNCIKKAEINNIKLISKPDASSLTIFDDLTIDEEVKEKGNRFMLIDLGAHLVQITINEIGEDNGVIKQIINPIGGDFGSMNINNDLLEIIKYVLGNDTINNAKLNQEAEYIRLLEEIEKMKKNIKENYDFDYEIPIRFKINGFKYLFFPKEKKEYNNYIIRYDHGYIYIPCKLVLEIIENRINEIIDFINKINLKKYKVNHIFLTGGFSKNTILINLLKKNITDIPVYLLYNQEKTIVKGALIDIINKNKIIQKNNENIQIYRAKKFRIVEIVEDTYPKSLEILMAFLLIFIIKVMLYFFNHFYYNN